MDEVSRPTKKSRTLQSDVNLASTISNISNDDDVIPFYQVVQETNLLIVAVVEGD